ncbi:MAG: TonB-dependent receptor [Chitinophagaceae bacterium]|nr:TonB-dependent receptor [Chitinophagaceae bacterium]
MKKQHFLLIIFLLLHGSFLPAQQYHIDGTVQNRQQEKLSRSTIVLQNISGKKNFISVVGDTSGYYRFENLSAGRYILTASHTGYVSAVSDTITVNIAASNYTWHFVLVEESATLKEITVKSKKQPVEIDKGKIIFNLQNMATTAGLTAFDALKKLPGITIDQEENILLRGSSGVNVLIDGKMTYLSGRQLSNFLKGISAEDLNKIELNLTPSAEYDAAGNTGIINIVPKKNLKKGYAVDIRSGISKGKYWMANENISVSHRSKKTSIYGSFDFKMPRYFWNSNSGNTIHKDGELITLQRQNLASGTPLYYSWRVGGEWQVLPKHRLGIDYNGYFDDWKSGNHSTIKSADGSGSLLSTIRSSNAIIEPYYYDALNLNYRIDIDSAGKKITAETHYVSYRNYSDGVLTTDVYNADESFAGSSLLRSHQPGFIKIKSAKADAELPFKKITIKTGLKYAEVNNDNQYRFDSLHNGMYTEMDSMSNHFKYKEGIAAAYISASEKFNKTSITAGLRWEYTKADGYTVKQDVSNHWKYGKLFPTLSIEQELNERDKMTFSVSRRINRPAYSELNPVRWYTDRYFYYSGNPDLVPEIAWILSTAYTLQRKYVFTITYNHSSNYINRKLTQDGSAVKTQAYNLGVMQRFDMMVSLPLQVTSFWEMQLMPVVSYMAYPISLLTGDKTLSKWFATLSAQQQFKLPANIKMDISTQCASASIRGVYITRSYFYTDIGFKRSFFSGKLDVQLSFSDILNTNVYRGVSQSDISNYYYRDKPDTRRVGFTLHYHFGSDLVKGNGKKTEEQERL